MARNDMSHDEFIDWMVSQGFNPDDAEAAWNDSQSKAKNTNSEQLIDTLGVPTADDGKTTTIIGEKGSVSVAYVPPKDEISNAETHFGVGVMPVSANRYDQPLTTTLLAMGALRGFVGAMMRMGGDVNTALNKFSASSNDDETTSGDLALANAVLRPVYQQQDPPDDIRIEGGNVFVPYKLQQWETKEDFYEATRIKYPEDSFIPLANWSGESRFGTYAIESNNRTLGPSFLLGTDSIDEYQKWWNSLSPTEQRIEIALATTDPAKAGFDNVMSFDETVTEVENLRPYIDYYADKFNMPPQLIQTILMSEMLYDYGTSDREQDASPPGSLYFWGTGLDAVTNVFSWVPIIGQKLQSMTRPWDAVGYANIHFDAGLLPAYEQMPDLWDNTPNYLSPLSVPNLMDDTINDDLSNIEKAELARYFSTEEGTVRGAAFVGLRYLNEYLADNPDKNLNNLTAEDFAIVWNAYRSNYVSFGENARLALPVAEYWEQRRKCEENEQLCGEF